MPIVAKESLKSDFIGVRFGCDGHEPKEVSGWCRKYRNDFPVVIAFAINQHYPEVASGFYRNRRLVALLQEALLEIGLHTVIEDNFSDKTPVPEELPGSLEVGDDYLLVDDSMNLRGRLNVWESLGGKSVFYHDRLIMEVITGEQHAQRLTTAVGRRCTAASVGHEILNPA